MTAASAVPERADAEPAERLPLPALLALFTAGFLGILNETVPAGLLPQLADGLGVSEAVAGQTITGYALATALTAVALNAALSRLDRRTLLVAALATFVVGNAVVAVSDDLVVVLAARVLAGVGAGLVWSNIAVFAARVASPRQQGRAISIAMAGIPAALSLGLPAGTLLGDAAGYHATFALMALAGLALIGWVLAVLPRTPGEQRRVEQSFAVVLGRPGVRTILVVAGGYMVAHNLLYTYIGPLADRAGVTGLTPVLLVFGVAALVSIWATGIWVEAHHRWLLLGGTVLVAAAALVIAFATASPVALYAGAAVWGLGFGGSATLFVTAGMRAARHDTFQAMLVTVYNVAIAAGGLVGGVLLAGVGVDAIPWVAVALLVPTVLVTIGARRHAFPATARPARPARPARHVRHSDCSLR